MNINNSAARLHYILRSAKEQKASTPTISAWKKILNLQSDDQLEIMSAVGKVFTLPLAITQAVKGIPELNHDLYLNWMPSVRNAFIANSWNGNINEFNKNIPETTLVSLQFVSENLNRLSPEKILDEDTYNEIRDSAWKILQDLSEAEIDDSVKNYLLKHLNLVIQALDDYQILGIEPLENAVSACYGSVITRRDEIIKSTQTVHGVDFWKLTAKIIVSLKIIQTTIKIGSDAVQLLQEIGIINNDLTN